MVDWCYLCKLQLFPLDTSFPHQICHWQCKIRHFTFGSQTPKVDKRWKIGNFSWWKMNTILHLSWLSKYLARDGSWLKFWDHVLNDGPTVAKHLTALFRLMTQPIFGTCPYLVNGCETVPEKQTLLSKHAVLRDHMSLLMDCIWLLCWNLVPVVKLCYELL